jgi:hypothetical protein
MSNHTIARLAAANPVPDPPPVEPAERLHRLIEAEGHATGGARRRTPAHRRMRPLAAVGAAMLAAAVGLLLSDGASSPGLNIAAAAYAATSSGGGVLEARFVDRMFLAHGRVATSHHREWIDASTGMRRERRTLPALISRHPHLVYEMASSPGWIEAWSNAAGQANVIYRVRYRARPALAGAPQPVSDSGATQEPAGIETYRRLYRDGAIKLVGRERRDGRLLWKLEGVVGFARTSARAKLVPLLALVVLVDPRTYLPVVQRAVNLLTGHRRQVQEESELLGYRRLPGGAASEALLKLAAQHPHARDVGENPPAPRPPRSHYIRERLP